MELRMEQIQRRLEAIAEDVVSRRMQDAEDALYGLGFSDPPEKCGCEIAEMVRTPHGSIIRPGARPLYLKPCEHHRRLHGLSKFVELAGPLQRYMPILSLP